MDDVWVVVAAAGLVVVAGLLAAADTALSVFSRARAEELRAEGRGGARYLVRVLDDPPRYLNSLILLRLFAEVFAIVLVTLRVDEAVQSFWGSILLTVAGMLVVSFVVIGVAPRTLGRQHPEVVALSSALPVWLLTRLLGPLPRLLILVGNAITPGKGFREGPFSTETELRELVDLAEASAVIESGERKMLHSVFEFGDTITREVMVPRPDVVFLERHRNLRQAMSLFLRSGYSRVPVVGENLDEVLGFAYLKDLARLDFEDREGGADITERIEDHMRPAHFVPDSKPVAALLAEMQAMRQHIAVVVDEYGGTAGIVTIEDVLEELVGEITDEYDDEVDVERVDEASYRVSSRFPIDHLDDLFAGYDIEEEDVDSVGGLMAKHLGLVPIPGSTVEAHGLGFRAEGTKGRRNQVSTVLVTRLADEDDEDEERV
ncbi:CBS domain containing-hemolysin-like protein [Nocardioides zeae]|uniref:CBS domain containing-hemolysin-like protein n=1 Tax=Nocardioides zeae TaxID=1457234 RepID=A0ACC6IGF3_9ACTN|nr:hemolysin family protein [Nocardioides zeae]MDR6172830.1 CBS domain containing-hemolysin-like protein [Nocardioides zeae]MDR6209840.1 CBS domain containing-hemolysin-like protein [Nocardioides zeae]